MKKQEKSNKKFIKYLIGIDEAGRGPLAGPITVAAIAITKSFAHSKFFKGIKDSKKLSPRKREEWRDKIFNFQFSSFNKISIATASVGASIIDKIGITKATDLAIKKVIQNLKRQINIKPSNCYFLLDGLLKTPKKYFQKTIIKGDEKIPLISAASIIAKVKRDKKMLRLHRIFPDYRFDLHKGYGTKLHYKMINKFGLTPFHRKSFCKPRRATSNTLPCSFW